MTTGTIELNASDFRSGINPDWCPGCGDFGVLNSLQRAGAELGLQPHRILTVSGIGCSSNLPGYINSYGMHTLHGRSLPFATGAKLANHELTVIATGGDGDGYGIGGNHLTHTARRNVDITYIVMNNQIYLSPKVAGIVVEDYVHHLATSYSPATTPLTDREREVLQLLVEGKDTKKIASHLHVSVKTVATHRQHIMDKLDIHSLPELTKYALREGLTFLEN